MSGSSSSLRPTGIWSWSSKTPSPSGSRGFTRLFSILRSSAFDMICAPFLISRFENKFYFHRLLYHYAWRGFTFCFIVRMVKALVIEYIKWGTLWRLPIATRNNGGIFFSSLTSYLRVTFLRYRWHSGFQVCPHRHCQKKCWRTKLISLYIYSNSFCRDVSFFSALTVVNDLKIHFSEFSFPLLLRITATFLLFSTFPRLNRNEFLQKSLEE